MITTSDADRIIQSQIREYGVEEVPYQTALGRVLAGQLFADRDMPPFNRSTVDGVALDFGAYEAGQRIFEITATQAAGMSPIPITGKGCCIEIMTGADLHHSANTVIRYEDIEITAKTIKLMVVVVNKGQKR